MSSTRPKKFMYVCLGILALAAAFAAGSISGHAQSPAGSDVAVVRGSASSGTIVTPPYYSDGTQADPSECVCLVSLRLVGQPLVTVDFRAIECKATAVTSGWRITCRYQGMNWADGTANYLIVAVRQGGAASAQPTTWGRIKAEFGE